MLIDKYGRGKDLRREILVRESDSLLWKELGKLWDILGNNQRWCVGDGRDTIFWLDNWGVCDFSIIFYLNLSIPMSDVFSHEF